MYEWWMALGQDFSIIFLAVWKIVGTFAIYSLAVLPAVLLVLVLLPKYSVSVRKVYQELLGK